MKSNNLAALAAISLGASSVVMLFLADLLDKNLSYNEFILVKVCIFILAIVSGAIAIKTHWSRL